MMDKSNIFRLLSVVILSSLTTYILYQSQILSAPKSPITVSFTARGNINSPFVLYYTEDDLESYTEEKKVLSENTLKKEETKFDIQLPCKHVSRIRVDFFERPGEVYISDISIKGDRKILFTYEDVKITNDLTFEQVPGGIKIISDKIDPYIEIPPLNLNCAIPFNLTAVIVWILLFLAYFFVLKNMSRKMHPENTTFVLCLLIIFFSPRFFVSDQTVSLAGKRALTTKPELNSKEDLTGYGEKYERWFNDHFFQREKFQSLHDRILNVFSKQGQLYKDAFIGENGWMFLRNDNGFENYANVNLFTNEELKSISQYLQKLNLLCTQKGMKFYFVISPDKDKIYGEYYKYVEKVNPDSLSRAQQLIKYLRENTNLKCLSLHDRLTKEKGNGLLYYKQDTHWCELGAYYGVDELLNFMSSDMVVNRCSIVSLDSMLWQNGDMRGMCPGYKETDDSYYKIPVMNVEKSAVFNNSTHYNCPSRQGKIMVYGDSFGYLLTKYLSYSFGEADLIPIARRDNGDYNISEDEINALNHDVVIFEIVERYIPQLYNPFRN